jgi:hypothetical protein
MSVAAVTEPLVMLPEIGGRIFLGQDKTNKDYDFSTDRT